MNWRTKTTAFRVLSSIPGGPSVYRFAREHLTKSLDPRPDRVKQKLDVGIMYLDALAAHNKLDLLLNGTHLDFGSGWHPTIPFLFYSMGVQRQCLFDLMPVLNRRMVEQTLATFRSVVIDPAWPRHSRLKRIPPEMQQTDWRKYLDQLGISYHAPYAESVPKLAEQIDVITSTIVLLYIPVEPLRWCIEQIHKCLKPGGLFLATIHLRDLYADSDKTISDYNHLQYSPEEWDNKINSALMSHNRLKARDYRELLENAGFTLPVFDVEVGTEAHLKQLDSIRIHPYFSRYSGEELAARHLFFIAQKK